MSRNATATITFLVLFGIVLLCQPAKVGFEKGHHGWVSSHTLAIITRAAPENGFVGYAWRFVERDFVSRGYFDRHPVLFAAMMRSGLVQAEDTLAARVLAARNFMNVIYALTGLFAYLFLRSVLQSRLAAFSATLLALSGTQFVHYKDMVHFDQPAVLGLTMVFYGIATFELESRRGPLLFAAIVAPLLGLGYASVVVLAYWTSLGLVRSRVSRTTVDTPRVTKARIGAVVIAGTLAASALLYNTLVEAYVNDVPLARTSIVESATKRLGLASSFNEEFARELEWGNFLPLQANRAYAGLQPLGLSVAFDALARGAQEGARYRGVSRAGREVLRVLSQLLTAAIALAGLFSIRRLDPTRRWVVIVVASVGILWIVGMRNLTAFHDYTAIYLVGLQLSVFGGFALATSKRYPRALLVVSMAVFLVSQLANLWVETSVARQVNGITRDLDVIREELRDRDPTVYVGDHDDYWHFLEGRPFFLGFVGAEYDFVLSPEEAEFVITNGRQDSRRGVSLTPGNEQFFLYRNVDEPADGRSRDLSAAPPGPTARPPLQHGTTPPEEFSEGIGTMLRSDARATVIAPPPSFDESATHVRRPTRPRGALAPRGPSGGTW